MITVNPRKIANRNSIRGPRRKERTSAYAVPQVNLNHNIIHGTQHKLDLIGVSSTRVMLVYFY